MTNEELLNAIDSINNHIKDFEREKSALVDELSTRIDEGLIQPTPGDETRFNVGSYRIKRTTRTTWSYTKELTDKIKSLQGYEQLNGLAIPKISVYDRISSPSS